MAAPRPPRSSGAEAAHRGAAPDAAGVEADDVEACPQHRRKELGQVADEVDTRNARAAGVDHQRPDPLTPGGRRTTDHRQRDLGPARVVVVQRRPNRRALEAVAARLPRHRARRQTRNRLRVRHGGRPASHRGQGPGGGGWHQRSGHRSHQGEAGRCDGDVPSMPGTCGLGEHEPPRLRRKPARRAGCTHRSCPAAGPARRTRSWGQLYRCAALMALTIHGSPPWWACQGLLSPVARQGCSLPARTHEVCRAGLHVESETVKSSTTTVLWVLRGPARTRPPQAAQGSAGAAAASRSTRVNRWSRSTGPSVTSAASRGSGVAGGRSVQPPVSRRYAVAN